MSRNVERTGVRDLAFSTWHRENFPDDNAAIDVDLMGSCGRCCAPLYLIESVRGDGPKPIGYLLGLRHALKVPVPTFLVRYWTDESGRINRLLAARRPVPCTGPDALDGDEFRAELSWLRAGHRSSVCAGKAPWQS